MSGADLGPVGHATDYGFTWGPIEVTRMAYVPGRGYVVGLSTPDRRVQVYVSEKGRSVRFWVDGQEVK